MIVDNTSAIVSDSSDVKAKGQTQGPRWIHDRSELVLGPRRTESVGNCLPAAPKIGDDRKPLA